jgi:hypothetical protein
MTDTPNLSNVLFSEMDYFNNVSNLDDTYTIWTMSGTIITSPDDIGSVASLSLIRGWLDENFKGEYKISMNHLLDRVYIRIYHEHDIMLCKLLFSDKKYGEAYV